MCRLEVTGRFSCSTALNGINSVDSGDRRCLVLLLVSFQWFFLTNIQLFSFLPCRIFFHSLHFSPVVFHPFSFPLPVLLLQNQFCILLHSAGTGSIVTMIDTATQKHQFAECTIEMLSPDALVKFVGYHRIGMCARNNSAIQRTWIHLIVWRDSAMCTGRAKLYYPISVPKNQWTYSICFTLVSKIHKRVLFLFFCYSFTWLWRMPFFMPYMGVTCRELIHLR